MAKFNEFTMHPAQIRLTEDEFQFFKSLGDELGLSVSKIIRNAAVFALMDSDNPVHAAREQHVTALPRVDRWRRKNPQFAPEQTASTYSQEAGGFVPAPPPPAQD